MKPHCLVRAGDLSRASAKDLERLQTENDLYAIVDFRDRVTARNAPDRAINGTTYHLVPALSLMNFQTEEESRAFDSLVMRDPLGMLFRAYRALALDPLAHESYRAFFRLLVEARGRGVCWHCTQGKDRTGVATILLLSALEVPVDAIRQDYLASNEEMQLEYDALAPRLNSEEQAFMRTELFVRPDCFDFYFSLIQEQYGSMDQYLESVLGVTPEKRKLLKANYLYQKEGSAV